MRYEISCPQTILVELTLKEILLPNLFSTPLLLFDELHFRIPFANEILSKIALTTNGLDLKEK